jgi:hypothetical protein
MVAQDITNPGPLGLKGGKLTQLYLTRLDKLKHQASVDAMVGEVCDRLLGKKMIVPTVGEAAVWAQAARFFDQRIQMSSRECRGRKSDMSEAAAKEMRAVLASITSRDVAWHLSKEAAFMLLHNFTRVAKDITNPGPNNIEGKTLTQLELKRVDAKHLGAVEAMMIEVCCRLLGKTSSGPSKAEEAQVWASAASYLSGRIQGTPEEMQGRNPDMSSDAAAALRMVLGQFKSS